MRQAVRFRVFKVTRDKRTKQVVSCNELRLKNGTAAAIAWKVRLANSKAAAQQYADEDGNINYDPTVVRNPDIKNRDDLVIDTKEQSPIGNGIATAQVLQGKFMGRTVTLGHAWTDDEGRLLVAGGFGKSESPTGDALDTDRFADNDGWYDDTSDGIVNATITLPVDGEKKAESARVIVAPFDFAPEIDSFITLHDVCYQAAIDAKWKTLPSNTNAADTNFSRDLLPILRRIRGYRWVNAATMRGDVVEKHGFLNEGGPLFPYLSDPTAIGPKPDPAKTAKALHVRSMLVAHVANPDPKAQHKTPREVRMPRLHDHENAAGEVLPLTWRQYRYLENWASGTFTNAPPPPEFTCEALDRIALEACSGGPFYPGMETPRIMREVDSYQAAFHLDDDLNLFPPGKITEGLAVPWQTDFFECVMDGEAAWWPATRPDKTLVNVRDLGKPTDFLSEAMEPWAAGVYSKQSMVDKWHWLGIVKATMTQDPKDPTKQIKVFIEDERDLKNLPRQRTRDKQPPV